MADVEEKPELAGEDVENVVAEENPPAPSPPIPREPEPEAPEPDCPKCVSGAPAWMATFADMATLLMAFFVLILSFAEMNVPKYKEVSGSMNDAFGVQRKVPVEEPPMSDSVIAKQFSQAKVETTPLNTIQEQTTDVPQPEDPELRVTTSPSDSDLSSDLEKVQAALKDEIARGDVEVVRQDDKISVVVNSASVEGLESGQDGNSSGRTLSQDTISLYAKVAEAQTSVVTEIQVVDKSPAQDTQIADASSSIPQEPQVEAGNNELEQIRARLAPEISQALVNVEMEDNQIKITLADQGSFVSGSADLRVQFLGLLDRVGQSISDAGGSVTISGHTDSIPIAFSMRFNSNWDLSAARSASVADYLVTQDYLSTGSVAVQGFADTVPLAPNDTADGRARNRRIEIMIDKRG